MRPSKLTPEIQESIVKLLEAGNFIETTCEALRLGRRTFNDWMDRGARDADDEVESEHREFYEAVQQARARAESTAVAVIFQAMPDHWQAAAWYLERTRPKKWARKVDDALPGKKGGQVRSLADIAAERKKAKAA